jgi:hypothetical protein
MAGQGAFEPDHYQDEFGSWEQALSTVGFDPEARAAERYEMLAGLNKSQQRQLKTLLDSNESEQFFRGQLLAELHRLAVELENTPSSIDMNEYGRYSVSSYKKYFGSWSEAVNEADLEPRSTSKQISDTELLAELRRVAEEVDGPLRSRDIRDRGQYSVPTYCARFGSWNEACEQAGV